jgi:hypothetical protein
VIANTLTSLPFLTRGARGSVVDWGIMLQNRRSRVRFPRRLLDVSIYLILPAALCLWRWLSLQVPLSQTMGCFWGSINCQKSCWHRQTRSHGNHNSFHLLSDLTRAWETRTPRFPLATPSVFSLREISSMRMEKVRILKQIWLRFWVEAIKRSTKCFEIGKCHISDIS